MADNLGIYFGIKGIDIIQVKGKNVGATIHIPQEKFSGSELEDKVPKDVKIVALVKDELRKQRIDAKSLAVALSGRDLIIRSFELPSTLPRDELVSAINFEVKKYLPFKIEEMVSDFQIKLDKKEKKNLVLFFGIKTETLKSYLSIIDQLGFKVSSLEYSAFSALRLAKAINLKMKGVFGLINIDFDDESNFMVLEDGFPLFSRDIELSAMAENEPDAIAAKLKNEIQLSLDYYYHRRFSSKAIEKIVFFGQDKYREIVNKFSSELDLKTEFIDIPKDYQMNLSAIKAYSASLLNSIKLPLKFNLLSKWEERRAITRQEAGIQKLSIKDFQPDSRVIALAVLAMAFSFVFGFYQRLPLNKQLAQVISRRPELLTVSANRPYTDIEQMDLDYKNKISTVRNLLNGYSFLTLQLNVLPRLLSKGIWLEEFSFRQNVRNRELLLKCFAYLGDRAAEIEVVDKFFASIKNNPDFSSAYKTIDIVSIQQGKIEEREVTSFAVSFKY